MTLPISLDNILSTDEGIEWYGKINNNNDIIEEAVNTLLSPVGHNHTGVYSPVGHPHSADVITCTLNGSSTNVQTAISSLASMIAGMNANASISAIDASGVGESSNVVTVDIALSNVAFGIFTVSSKWSNNATDIDFGSARQYNSTNAEKQIIKPSTGWDTNNQQYLHIRAVFTNIANQSGTVVYGHFLVNKWSRDVTAEELTAQIIANQAFMNKLSSDLISNSAFRNDVAVKASELL